MSEKNFVAGMFFKSPSPKAPDWIKGNISIRVKDFMEWFAANSEGEEWLNVDVKESKGGKLYCELSTYKRGQAKPTGEQNSFRDTTEPALNIGQEEEILADSIPF